MRKLFLSSLFILIVNFCFSQELAEKIVAALDSFSFIRPQEKAYIQTDRNSFAAGETVWFKTYVTLKETPTILSQVAYIELINQEGKLIEKKMLHLMEGMADGSFELKSTLPTGNYYLRSYTLWMLNFPSFINEKKISVVNIKTAVSKKQISNAVTNINLHFFPESGNLIEGLQSRVAFKAVDANGNPVNFKGKIINSNNELVLELNSVHDGMGSFEITPAVNQVYKAQIELPNGRLAYFNLPTVLNEGIVLSADNNNPNKLFVKAERGLKNKDLYNELLVVAQMNYEVVYMGKMNFEEGQDALAINKKNLPPGILLLTVFTPNGLPLAERIVFIANHSCLPAALQIQDMDLRKRMKNQFIIDTTGFHNLRLSISVTNALADSAVATDNILSGLLLSTEIKGTIHHPAYYFLDKSSARLQQLDLVMLTNGWRRYKLEDLMKNQFSPIHYPFERGISISGKVLHVDGKSVLKAAKINLMIKGEDSTSIMSQANTNETGNFVVDQLDFKKSATIYYQGTNLNNSEALVAVKLNPAYFDSTHLPAQGFTGNQSNELVIEKSNYLNNIIQQKQGPDTAAGKMLQEVVMRSKKHSTIDSLNSLYASDQFMESDQSLVMNENVNYNDIWRYLQAMVPGININRTDSGPQVNFTRYQGLDFFSENTGNAGVQFFLNEIPVSVDIIDMLLPSDVGLIKVYKGNTAIALGAGRGAIALYTVKGKSVNDWRKKGFESFKKEGYAVKKEFYAMDYTKLNPAAKSADLRPTLYWNPTFNPTEVNNSFSFYNDDICKKIRVVIEGMDQYGKLFYTEKIME